MKDTDKIIHLDEKDIIKNGSYFTSNEIVDLVFDMCDGLIDNKTKIIDMGSGYGSFIKGFNKYERNCIGTDCDEISINFLKEHYKKAKFFCENSVLNVNREKYGLTKNDKLIAIGNPPYNDITSIYKKGEKGSLVCDDDLISRDLGITFLKAYNKLKCDYVCVLHPLAYLIKKQNFNSLKAFKDNYKLLDATIFSSKEFKSIKKTSADFPVVAALYERNIFGMNYEDIIEFKFKIYKSNKSFCLHDINTIDGIINKYPSKNSKCKIQFYTLRDMNALHRNATFIDGPIQNGIDIDINNLYQYAWLLYLKNNFNPNTFNFIYGNLSPLYSKKIENDDIKSSLVKYAYDNSEIIKKYYTLKQLDEKYKISKTTNFKKLENILNSLYF